MTRPTFSLTADFDSGSADLTPYCRDGFTVSRGSSQIVTTGFVADPGTAQTQLDNITRIFDPNYSAGAHFGELSPGVPAAIGGNWDAVDYEILTGTIDDFPQDYPLDGADQLINLQITDGTQLFSNGSLYIQRGTDHSGTRVVAVADALNWTGGEVVSYGNAVINALKLGTITAWSHLTDVANAEWGELYFAKNGDLTFRSRDTILSDARSTVSQASFVQSGGLNFSGCTMGSPQIVNDCTISYNDRGDEVNAQDAASIASRWKVHSLPLSLPLHTATQAQQYAQWIVDRYKTPIYTFKTITLTPSNEPGDPNDLWAQALGRELGDLITVTLDPLILDVDGITRVLSGAPIVRECWIRGIQHNFNQQPWSTTFTLQDASWRTGLARFDVSTWDGGDVYAM